MPTYEYACTRCGQHVEVFQRLSEEPLTTCGACGGPLRKVFHPVGIVFKGSGFYATDSRSKPSTSGSDKNGDGKADTKSEKKSESSSSEPSSAAATTSTSSGTGASSGASSGGPSGGSSGGEKAS